MVTVIHAAQTQLEPFIIKLELQKSQLIMVDPSSDEDSSSSSGSDTDVRDRSHKVVCGCFRLICVFLHVKSYTHDIMAMVTQHKKVKKDTKKSKKHSKVLNSAFFASPQTRQSILLAVCCFALYSY